MLVDNSPIQTSYLRFNMSDLAGKTLLSAKLRIKVANDTSSGTSRVKPVTSTTWNESTLTYANRPALGSTTLGSFTPSSSNTWKEVTVTSHVTGKLGSLVSFGIDSGSSDSVTYYSKETVDKPILILTYR